MRKQHFSVRISVFLLSDTGILILQLVDERDRELEFEFADTRWRRAERYDDVFGGIHRSESARSD